MATTPKGVSVMKYENKQWIYQQQPTNRIGPEHYRLETHPLDAVVANNEVIVEMKYISVDPYMRIAQASRDNWEKPHPLNTLQGSGTIGQIIVTSHPNFAVGDWVLGYLGWQKYCKCYGDTLTKIDPIVPVTTSLGVLGMPGRTAWFGLMEAGRPRPGEVIVVSGAAGAVGSLVAQFGKFAGCKVFGIAGSSEKCQYLLDTLHLDGAVNYRDFNHDSSLLSAHLLELTGGGVDVYFDNVGGWITDAILPIINLRARVVICGQITQYEGKLDAPELGPRFLHHLLFQRATIQGILARDFTHRMAELRKVLTPWILEQRLVFEETVLEGFELLPEALNMLFEGRNLGKLIVKV